MTADARRNFYVIPPPGPLCWLHPELGRLSSAGAVELLSESGEEDEQVLDLAQAGHVGEFLLSDLASRNPAKLRIEDGPRGRTFWLWAGRALRAQGLSIPMPSVLPARADEAAPRAKGGARPLSLEGLLMEAADLARGEETVVVQGAPAAPVSRPALEKVPLTGRTASAIAGRAGREDPPPLWLLPLQVGPELWARIETCAARIAQDVGAFREACLVPYFATDCATAEASAFGEGWAETRLPLSWWGVLPGDRWPPEIRRRFLELLGLLHPDRVHRFRAFENAALAGIDCYGEALAGRFESARTKERKKPRPLIVGICGTDGSGKSSHAAALREHLEKKGLKACVRKIYRHGVFHETVTDLTRRCGGERNLHLWRLQRIIKAFDSVKYYFGVLERELDSFDVMIFDRYVYTHYAAGVGRYHHDPFTRELLEVYPEADLVFLLDLPSEEADRRIGSRQERTVDENPYMLSRYRHALLDLADRHSFQVLSALDPFERNRDAILERVDRLLRERGMEGRSEA